MAARQSSTHQGTTHRSAKKAKTSGRRAARATSPRRRKAAHKAAPAKHGTGAGKTTTSAARATATPRWSQRVTKTSDSLDLKGGVFTLKDPARIAASLKRSAERSTRRKTDPFRSAMSMLTFYINRAGRTLPASQRARLERAKAALRRQFGR